MAHKVGHLFSNLVHKSAEILPHGDVEAVLLFLVLDVAAVALVVEILQHLAEDGAEVLRRHVFVGAAAQFRDLDIAPVGQVEGGSVAVGETEKAIVPYR